MTFARRTMIAIAGMLAAGVAFAAEAPVYKEFVEGNAKAAVTVVEYASLTCPHCARFFQNSYPMLKRDYIDTGKIKFIFRDFPTAPESLAFGGAVLARCVVQKGGGMKMIGMMFENQSAWMQEPEKTLKDYAKKFGMDDAAFEACLKNHPLQEAMMKSITEAVEKYHVSSTPSFLVNDTLVESGEDYPALKEAVDKALAGNKI